MQRGEKLEVRHDVDMWSVLSWVDPGALHIIEEVRGSQCQEALALLLLAAVVNIACRMSGTKVSQQTGQESAVLFHCLLTCIR